MAHPTNTELLNLVSETGYEGRSLEIMVRLFNILQAISDDDFLCNRLAIKGGTALNAFHLDLNRLSLDIDLEYIGQIGEDEDVVQAERNDIDGKLSRILDAQGYRLKVWRGRDGSNWTAGFDSALGGASNLHIDLGYVYRQPLFGVSRMPSAKLGGWGVTGMLVLDIVDVFVGKLTALTQRTAARDLFDVRSIMDNGDDLEMKNVRAAFIASVTASREGWGNRRIDSRGANPHDVCQKLVRCMPHRHFRNKNETVTWFNESIAICRERFGGLLVLTRQEHRFVDLVQTRGEVRADLLSTSPNLRDRIAAWPRLAWRCREVR